MTPIYLFEDSHFEQLYPLTYTRPACLLPCGTSTLLARLQRILPLAGAFMRPAVGAALKSRLDLPINPAVSTRDGVILVNARWLMLPDEAPTADLASFFPTRTAGLVSNAIAWIHLPADLAEQVASFSRLLP